MTRQDRLALAFETGALEPPPEGDILVTRAATPALAEALPRARLLFEQSFRPHHDLLAAAGLRVTLRAETPVAMAIVTVGRVRAETLGDVAHALGLLAPGGVLAIDGAKTDGVDSIARALGAVLAPLGAFAKAHGRVAWFTRPETLPAEVAAWAAAAAPARIDGGLLTAPGLFSPEGPDPGSRRLAAAFAGALSGRVADLGAGWGWLAAEALRSCPGIAEIALFEAEARALDAARVNLPDPRARFVWSDVRGLDRADGPFDAVIANPPFHVGRAAEPGLGAAFIAAAGRILRPSGRLWLVANRQLPYEAALDAAFARWDKRAEDGIYKVLTAERPRKR